MSTPELVSKDNTEELSGFGTSNLGLIPIGSIIVFSNLILMSFVSLYWINPDFHQFMTGKPL